MSADASERARRVFQRLTASSSGDLQLLAAAAAPWQTAAMIVALVGGRAPLKPALMAEPSTPAARTALGCPSDMPAERIEELRAGIARHGLIRVLLETPATPTPVECYCAASINLGMPWNTVGPATRDPGLDVVFGDEEMKMVRNESVVNHALLPNTSVLFPTFPLSSVHGRSEQNACCCCAHTCRKG